MIHYMRGFDHARIVVELMHVHMKLLSTQACVNYHECEKCEGKCESTHVHQATHAHSGGQSLGVKPYIWLQCIFRVWLPGANRPTSSAWALIAAPWTAADLQYPLGRVELRSSGRPCTTDTCVSKILIRGGVNNIQKSFEKMNLRLW